MKKLLGCFLCVMLLVFGSSIAGAAPINLDISADRGVADSFTTADGTSTFTCADTLLSYPSSGTGVFQPYLTFKASHRLPAQFGMGTDATGVLDNQRMGNPSAQDGWTHSIQIKDLYQSSAGIYEFLIDLNEPHRNPRSEITLTELKIYIATDTSLTSEVRSGRGTWDNAGADLGKLVYNMDADGNDVSVLMDYANWMGQGQNVDTIVEVPFSLPSDYTMDDYVYTYWSFSGQNAGFEEISLRQTPSVPEPATMLLLGTGILCLGVFGRKKFKV
jgi:hypothetical protein